MAHGRPSWMSTLFRGSERRPVVGAADDFDRITCLDTSICEKTTYNIRRASRAFLRAPVTDSRLVIMILTLMIPFGGTGCTAGKRQTDAHRGSVDEPVIIVVAPVINLSAMSDLDPVVLTDWVAAEWLDFPNVGVVPVNMTLAALQRQGKYRVETPADAVALAEELGADATVVTAITEYDPYDPPRVGLVMQWYGVDSAPVGGGLDPVLASRDATGLEVMPAAADERTTIQVQRGFNAAHQGVLRELREYARDRDGEPSALGWKKYVHSQELFVRYCAWSVIRTMLTVRHESRTVAPSEEPAQ